MFRGLAGFSHGHGPEALSTLSSLAESLEMVPTLGVEGRTYIPKKWTGEKGKPLTALVQLAGQSEVMSFP